MEKKMIPAKGKSRKGIIGEAKLNDLCNKIKYNYALFGNKTNKVEVAIFDLSRVKQEVNGEAYITVSIDNGELGFVEKDKNYQLHFFRRDEQILERYIGSNKYNMSVDLRNKGYNNINFDPNINDIDSLIDDLCTDATHIDYLLKFYSDEDGFYYTELDTIYTDVFSSTKTKKVIYCRSSDSVEFEDDRCKAVVIFPATICVPLVRIYKSDIDITDELIFDFEDNEDNEVVLYNSYYSKYDYYTESRKLVSVNPGIRSMKYNGKINDIIAYLKSEEYEELDNGNYKYTNENGMSIEYFTQESDKAKDCTEFVERFSYKGVKIFDNIICKNKKGIIEYQERVNLRSRKIDETVQLDNYYEIIKKYLDIINNAAKITIGFDEKISSLTVEKSTIDDRSIISLCSPITTIIIELYNNDKYAFVRYANRLDKDGLKSGIDALIDGDELILFTNKQIMDHSYILYTIRKNNNISSKIDSFYLNVNFYDNDDHPEKSYKMVQYNGVEGNFYLKVKNDTIVEILDFNSSIYSQSDEFIYIRNNFGVPEKLYLR